MKFIWIYLLRFWLILLVTLLLAVSVFLFSYTYQTFTYTLFEQLGQLDKLEKFRKTMLTSERFLLLRMLSVGIAALGLLGLFYVWRQVPVIAGWGCKLVVYIHSLYFRINLFWKSIPVSEKTMVGVLLLCVIGSRLYFLLRFPFHIDERFSYLYFVSKGVGVSLAYYPNPNNHILYTLFCQIARLFLDDPALVMKVPSFIFGIMLTVLFWGVARYYFGFSTALLASALFSFSDQVFYYGMQGRGYTLMLVCTLIAMVSAMRIIYAHQPNRSSYIGFCLCSVLGFYTVPVFLYPFSGIVAFACVSLINQKAFSKLKWLAVSIMLIIGGVFLLYLPVFLFNGFTAISGNGWVAPLPFTSFLSSYPANLLDLNANLWGDIPFGHWLTWLVIPCCISILIYKRELPAIQQWAGMFLMCLLLLIFISFLQRVLLYQRVLIYLSLFQYLLLAVLTVKVVHLIIKEVQLRKVTVVCLSLFVTFINVYAFYRYTSSEKFNQYDSFDATANLLYEKNADTIFVNYYEYSLCIRFRYETSGKAVIMDTHDPVPETAYQYLVIHNSRPVPVQFEGLPYAAIYKDLEVTVFELQ